MAVILGYRSLVSGRIMRLGCDATNVKPTGEAKGRLGGGGGEMAPWLFKSSLTLVKKLQIKQKIYHWPLLKI